MNITFSEVSELVDRCVIDEDWPRAKALVLVEQYIWFLSKKIQLEDWNGEILSPSPLIDIVWHIHILDTSAYRKACGSTFVDHVPQGAYHCNTKARNKRYTQTYEHLVLEWEEISDEIWPKPVQKEKEEKKKTKKRERSEQETKTLIIKSLAGKTTIIEIPTVSAKGIDIMMEVRKQNKIPLDMMRFVYAGEPIGDETSVDFLRDGSILHMILALGGC